MSFARQWIADSGLHPDDLVMLYAPDDLMTPTILPFNLMLFDIAARLTDKPAISVSCSMGGCGSAAPDALATSW